MSLIEAESVAPPVDLQFGRLPGRFVQLTPGKAAVSETVLDPADPIFVVHFPEWPVLPGSFVLRTALATAASVEGAGSWRLGSVSRIAFRQGARPGSVLRIEVKRAEGSDAAYTFSATAAGTRIADGAVTLIMEPQP